MEWFEAQFRIWLCHTVEIDKDGNQAFVGAWAVLENASEIGMDSDAGYRASVEAGIRARLLLLLLLLLSIAALVRVQPIIIVCYLFQQCCQ